MAKKKKNSIRRTYTKDADPVFTPITFDTYKKTKIDLLNAQVKSLECVKTITRIRNLQKSKEELKLELYKVLSEILRLYYQIQNSLPVIKNPGFMKKIEKSISISISYKEEFPKTTQYNTPIANSATSELDKELKDIQAKLLSLNSD